MGNKMKKKNKRKKKKKKKKKKRKTTKKNKNENNTIPWTIEKTLMEGDVHVQTVGPGDELQFEACFTMCHKFTRKATQVVSHHEVPQAPGTFGHP